MPACFGGGSAFADVAINDVNFPDDNFRAYVALVEEDYSDYFFGEHDGILSDIEIQYFFTDINVASKDISSLKGIELFTNLQILYCYSNDLTELDLSKNTALVTLYCQGNKIEGELDLSKNTSLLDFNCTDNQITSLNFGDNVGLMRLYCSKNHYWILWFKR